jgi:hypothetical protein
MSVRKQLIAESVALGAEGKYCSRRDLRRRQRQSSRIKRHQLSVAGQHGADVVNREPEMQTSAAADRIRMPRILTAGSHHASRTGGGSHPNRGSKITQVSGILQQHDVPRARQDRFRIQLDRTSSHGNDLATWHHPLEGLWVDNLNRNMHIWGEPLDQLGDSDGIRGPGSENLPTEPNCVLYRVKALEDDQLPGTPSTGYVLELHV